MESMYVCMSPISKTFFKYKHIQGNHRNIMTAFTINFVILSVLDKLKFLCAKT